MKKLLIALSLSTAVLCGGYAGQASATTEEAKCARKHADILGDFHFCRIKASRNNGGSKGLIDSLDCCISRAKARLLAAMEKTEGKGAECPIPKGGETREKIADDVLELSSYELSLVIAKLKLAIEPE